MFIIDRFEEGFAVVENTEDESMIQIEKSMVDEAAREGDVIFPDESGYKVDIEATRQRREEVLELLRSIDIKNNEC